MGAGRYRQGAPRPPWAGTRPPAGGTPPPWGGTGSSPASTGRVVLAVGGALVLVAAYVGGMIAMAANNAGRFGADDTRLDDPAVVAAAQRGCARLSAALDGFPRPAHGDTPREILAYLRAETQAIRALTAELHAVGSEVLAADPPAAAWLADWEALAAARDRYVVDTETHGAAFLRVPNGPDGRPVTERIAEVHGGCAVPDRLLRQLLVDTTR